MKKLNFVFDTNSLISAVLSPNSTNAIALKKAKSIGNIVYSKDTFDEFIDVLFRPKFDKYFSVEARLNIIDLLLLYFIEYKPQNQIFECRDMRDNKFLELAIETNASFIISGDQDLLVLNPFRNISILNAADFVALDLT